MESTLSSRMDTYISSSILPSTSASIPPPFQPMHPQTIFTVPWTFLFCKGLPAFFHTYILPSDPITLVQSSKVQSLLVLESKFQPSLSMCGRQKKLLFLHHSLWWCSLENIANILGRDRGGKGIVDEMGGLGSIISLSSGRPNVTFSFSGRASLMALATVDLLRLCHLHNYITW